MAAEILMKYKRDDPHAPTSPENFADAIRNFDRHVCHEAFLSSLLGILPQPDTVSQVTRDKSKLTKADCSLGQVQGSLDGRGGKAS